MAKVVKVWKGTGYDKEVRLKQYQNSDGSYRYEFRNRFGKPSNPTEQEAKRIIKLWGLVEA